MIQDSEFRIQDSGFKIQDLRSKKTILEFLNFES